MKASELLNIKLDNDFEVSDICESSKDVVSNSIFIAFKGHNYDGNDLNDSFDTLRLPKRLVDSPPTAASVDTKESSIRL